MGRVKRVLTGKSEIVLNKGGSIAAPTFFAHFSFHVTSATIFVACTAISWPQFLDNSALKLEPQTPNEPNFSHQASFDRITFFAPFISPVVCENIVLTVKLWTTVGWGVGACLETKDKKWENLHAAWASAISHSGFLLCLSSLTCSAQRCELRLSVRGRTHAAATYILEHVTGWHPS